MAFLSGRRENDQRVLSVKGSSQMSLRSSGARCHKSHATCQVFAQKPAAFTLAQKLIQVLLEKQGTKASAHITRSGMFRPEPDALDLLIGELEPPGNGPHLLDEPNDPVVIQPRSRLAQPVACPKQHIVG